MPRQYLEQIKHIKNLLGGINNIAVSTDDMTFENNPEIGPAVFKHEDVADEIRRVLYDGSYSPNTIEKILWGNFEEKVLIRI